MCLEPLFGVLSTILQPKITVAAAFMGATEKTSQNGQNLKKWKSRNFSTLMSALET